MSVHRECRGCGYDARSGSVAGVDPARAQRVWWWGVGRTLGEDAVANAAARMQRRCREADGGVGGEGGSGDWGWGSFDA